MQDVEPFSLLITCEHGGNSVPAIYTALFRDQADTLASHRGFDAGALELGQELAAGLGAPYYYASVTRLLIDLNRSVGHPALYSEFTTNLPARERADILAQYYKPQRQRIEACVQSRIATGATILHIASHSFTPEWQGKERTADVGLLYDPTRRREQHFARHWQNALVEALPDLRVRRNYPYLGSADGLTTSLRRKFGPDQYLGLELEINQRWVFGPAEAWAGLKSAVLASLTQVLARHATGLA